MDKKARSIDGIILRPKNHMVKRKFVDISSRRGRVTLDNVTGSDINENNINLEPSPEAKKQSQTRARRIDDFRSKTLLIDDINSSLSELNEVANTDRPKSAKSRKLKKNKNSKLGKNPKKHKKVIKRIIITAIIVLLAIGGFFVYKIISTGDSIFEGNVLDVFKSEKLAEDENGRSNILIFGTAPIDHDGPLLADTVMVLSISQSDKTAYMISLPRDLYVEHYCPNPDINTNAGKLNETYKCVYDESADNESEASDEFRKIVGEVLGIDVQYYAHLSWDGVREIVDSVGGIDVTIESDDPRGVYDAYTGIQYSNGEVVHLDGEAALVLARSRGAGGGYGFESFGGSNYFRERTQQKIIQALQAKALSSGTLSNPVAAMNILTTLGSNLRTNFKTSEVQSLIKLASETDTSSITSIPLIDETNNVSLIASDMVNGASIEVPTAGMFNYSEIQKYIMKKLSNDPIVQEAAVVDVLNGSGTEGVAITKANELESLNYNIGLVDNAPDGQYDAVEIYQLNIDKTETAKALEKKYNVVIKTKLPAGVLDTADFVIIFGS